MKKFGDDEQDKSTVGNSKGKKKSKLQFLPAALLQKYPVFLMLWLMT